MASVNQRVIDGFRAGGGIGVEGMHRERLVLLTTTGRTTGERRTTPLMRIPWEDGVLVVASNDGAPGRPAWFTNLAADPRVHVETPEGEWDGTAATLAGDERAEAWRVVLEVAPFFADMEERAGRELPLVALRPA